MQTLTDAQWLGNGQGRGKCQKLPIPIPAASIPLSEAVPMTHAHRLDCETQAADCRFIIQSENEAEVVELAKNHMRKQHGQEYSGDELRRGHLQTV